MHSILGANGVIGRELATALAGYTPNVRLVSRNPERVNATDEVVAADLLDPKATEKSVSGSEVVYLVVGLKYDTAVWQEQWPKVMRNVIDACARHGSRLVFIDNVYAYGLVRGAMTEETPFNPVSKKGEIRAQVATMLLDAMRQGHVQGMIARSADFYGPGAVNSFPYVTVFTRLKAKKAPQWIGNPKVVHTFTYTPDAGRALALLGNTPEAFGQTWHLPTTKEPLTGAGFASLACELAGQPDKLLVAPRFVLNLMSRFVPVLRENREMMYQFDEEYCFDSSKIEAAFGMHATPYRAGITATLSAHSPQR